MIDYLGILDLDPDDFRRSNKRSTKIWDTGQPRKIKEKLKWTIKNERKMLLHNLLNLGLEIMEEFKKWFRVNKGIFYRFLPRYKHFHYMKKDTCSILVQDWYQSIPVRSTPTPDPYLHSNGGQTLGTHWFCPPFRYMDRLTIITKSYANLVISKHFCWAAKNSWRIIIPCRVTHLFIWRNRSPFIFSNASSFRSWLTSPSTWSSDRRRGCCSMTWSSVLLCLCLSVLLCVCLFVLVTASTARG